MSMGTGAFSEARMKAEVTRADGTQQTVYAYKSTSKFKTLLWQLRHGKNGERISAKEAAKFDAQ